MSLAIFTFPASITTVSTFPPLLFRYSLTKYLLERMYAMIIRVFQTKYVRILTIQSLFLCNRPLLISVETSFAGKEFHINLFIAALCYSYAISLARSPTASVPKKRKRVFRGTSPCPRQKGCRPPSLPASGEITKLTPIGTVPKPRCEKAST